MLSSDLPLHAPTICSSFLPSLHYQPLSQDKTNAVISLCEDIVLAKGTNSKFNALRNNTQLMFLQYIKDYVESDQTIKVVGDSPAYVQKCFIF